MLRNRCPTSAETGVRLGPKYALWLRRNSLFLRRWYYNAVGALIKYHWESGDTNTVSYGQACGSGTGYPCLPSQRVVSRLPDAPDTTKWFYTGELVDSIYTSNTGSKTGMTRYWWGTYARLDSIADHDLHTRRFTHEGTWGNPERVISDSLQVYSGSFTWARDTTAFGYDVTGRVAATRRGAAGRVAIVLRDRMARDTMVVDSAEGGGAAITTTTRFNDAVRTVTVVDGNGRTLTFLHDDRGRRIRRTDAASARDTFAYDGDSRLIAWHTRRGDSLLYSYDALGRLRTKVVSGPGGGTWTYGYHGTYGTLDTLLTASDSVYRSRNSWGWMTEEKTVVSGVTRTVQYAYNQAGGLTTITDPWAGAYTLGWNLATRARTITNPFSESFTITHTKDGLVSGVTFPTGTDARTYNRAHQVTTAGLSGEISYTRDPITKGINGLTWGGVTQRFGYDGFGRLA
jgi:YD repeat-containing protein